MGSCFGRCVSKACPHGGGNANGTAGTEGGGAGGVGATSSSSSSCLWRQATDEQDAELISNASERSATRKENFIFRIIKFKRKQKHRQFIDRFWERQDKNYEKIVNGNGGESIADIPLQNLDVSNLLNSSSNYAKESVMNYTSQNNNNHTSSRASSSLDLEWEHEYLRHFSSTHATQQPHHHQQQLRRQQQLQQQNQPFTQHADNHDTKFANEEDSWQFLSHPNNDEDQLNSLASTHSLPHTATTTNANERYERRLTRTQSKMAKQNGGGGGSFTRTSSHNNSWSHISTPESLEWDIDEDQQRQLRVEDDNLGYETLELLHQIEQLKNQVLHETGEGLYESGDIEFSAIAPEAADIS